MLYINRYPNKHNSGKYQFWLYRMITEILIYFNILVTCCMMKNWLSPLSSASMSVLLEVLLSSKSLHHH